jgi:hypothetical protein
MSISYIRIDVELPSSLAERFLQGVRDIEQTAPDDIHLVISIEDREGSLQSHLAMLQALSPGFQFHEVVTRGKMNAEQRAAHDAFLERHK